LVQQHDVYQGETPVIGSILVPVDRTADAEAGLEWAKHAARKSGAAVHILSVVDANGAGDTTTAEAYLRERSQEATAAGVAARPEVAEGIPAEVILERADGAELTVMTHRRRWDFGGCLATVLREMRGPVLVVRPGAGEAPGLGNPTMLVPLDQPAFSRCVLGAVDMLAGALRFRVVLCRVIKPFGPYLDPTNAPPGIAAEIQNQIDAATYDLERDAGNLSGPEKPEIVVAMGEPSHEIVRTAARYQAGLIAMATRGGDNLSRVMGSTAHAVLLATRVPCLLVRPSDAAPSPALETGATSSRVA
jgi:nucleotide-binding universal stress UspA family protein